MPEFVKLSPRLSDMFLKTKLLCFGRYALEVPMEAELIWGPTSFPSKLKVFSGSIEMMRQEVKNDIANLKDDEKTVEIKYNREGPVENSWQVRYYPSENAKSEGLYIFHTYVNKGDFTFRIDSAIENDETEDTAAFRVMRRAQNLSLRTQENIPQDPGFCVEHGFMASSSYIDQEMVNVGVYLPSFPDISFSISSNKNAYGDYSPDEFEKIYKPKLSLLARIKEAKDEHSDNYPSRTVLREGKRDVQHWHGEESLIIRKDGTHDFEWALVGTPKDVTNPSDFSAQMYTKVEHNTVGAAKSASLSNDEAVALWDKLLSGLKFRVKVPGAPEGSYFIPPVARNKTISNP